MVSNCNNIFNHHIIDWIVSHPHNWGDSISYIYRITPTWQLCPHLLNPCHFLVGLLLCMYSKYFHHLLFPAFFIFFVFVSAGSFVFICPLPFSVVSKILCKLKLLHVYVAPVFFSFSAFWRGYDVRLLLGWIAAIIAGWEFAMELSAVVFDLSVSLVMLN